MIVAVETNPLTLQIEHVTVGFHVNGGWRKSLSAPPWHTGDLGKLFVQWDFHLALDAQPRTWKLTVIEQSARNRKGEGKGWPSTRSRHSQPQDSNHP